MLDVTELKVNYPGFSFGPASFCLADGQFLSLIGTNGSGKSTMIRSILGLNDRVTSGNVSFDGISTFDRPLSVFSHIGYVSDSSKDIMPEFTAQEYWDYCLLAYGRTGDRCRREDRDSAARYAALLDFPLGIQRPLAALSLGTVRKAQIIAALLSRPRLLILDEPFIGLDFLAARALEELLRELRAGGLSVLASSHDLDLASRLADRLLVLHSGRVVLNQGAAEIGGPEDMESLVRRRLTEARAH